MRTTRVNQHRTTRFVQIKKTYHISPGDLATARVYTFSAECDEETEEIHENFLHVNPDDLDLDNNLNQVKKTLRRMDIKTDDDLLQEARKLDQYQKKALHVAVSFAQDVIIARKGKMPYPKAPFLMVHGGAGSGKSTLIHVIAQ